MKYLLSFCFFCVSLHCFGVLSEEEMQKADEISWPAGVISVFYGDSKTKKETLFRQAFQKVEESKLSVEQKIHRCMFILMRMNGQGLQYASYEFCRFLVSPKYLEDVAFYLLNYVKPTFEKTFELDQYKYMRNRERVLTALKLISDNVMKVLDKKQRHRILRIYNPFAKQACRLN